MTFGSPARQAARLLAVGFDGASFEPAIERRLARLQPGGVILFARNVEDGRQLRGLVAAIRSTVPGCLLFIDAEGGRVDRLKGLLGPAPAAASLAGRPPRIAEQAGRWIGHGLRCFDLDVDLAPVVDLDHGETGNALDGRYLGRDPRAVWARARAFLRGLESAGVGGCLKHFPGLGRASADTHLEGAPIAAAGHLLERDLDPFRRLAGEAGAVMVGHATYPALDGRGRPASLSPSVVGTLLRERLAFDGLVMSDDLDMRALDAWGELPRRSEAAFAAGCDLLFTCRDLERAPEIVARLARPRWAERRRKSLDRQRVYREKIVRLRRSASRFTEAVVRRRLRALVARCGEVRRQEMEPRSEPA